MKHEEVGAKGEVEAGAEHRALYAALCLRRQRGSPQRLSAGMSGLLWGADSVGRGWRSSLQGCTQFIAEVKWS